jgi:hypothetical protein
MTFPETCFIEDARTSIFLVGEIEAVITLGALKRFAGDAVDAGAGASDGAGACAS